MKIMSGKFHNFQDNNKIGGAFPNLGHRVHSADIWPLARPGGWAVQSFVSSKYNISMA